MPDTSTFFSGREQIATIRTPKSAAQLLVHGISRYCSGHVQKAVIGMSPRVLKLLRVDTPTFFIGRAQMAAIGTDVSANMSGLVFGRFPQGVLHSLDTQAKNRCPTSVDDHVPVSVIQKVRPGICYLGLFGPQPGIPN